MEEIRESRECGGDSAEKVAGLVHQVIGTVATGAKPDEHGAGSVTLAAAVADGVEFITTWQQGVLLIAALLSSA